MPQVDFLTVIVLALAVYRLCRLVIEDTVFNGLRNLVWSKFPPSTLVGYWFTCYWCTSVWFASLVVISYMIIPVPTFVVSLILALSTIVGIVAARIDN
jgi:hypothetical protein